MEVCVFLMVVELILLIVSMLYAVKENSRASWWGAAASMVAIIITYFLTPVPAPVFYPTDGQLLADGVVEIRTDSRLSDIYYTLDSFSDPKDNGQRYVGVIRLNASMTVQARTRFLGKWSELQTVEMQFPEKTPEPTTTSTAIPKITPTPEPTTTPTPEPTAVPTPEPTPEPTPIPTPEPTVKPTVVIQTGEISDSWEEILAAIDDGTAEDRYAVGAWKPLDLGKYGVINMQLAGFDLDIRADGRGKAATTWIAKELLPETHVMCEDGDNWYYNGWKGSNLRNWLQFDVLLTFPDMLRSRMVHVNKEQSYPSGSQTSADNLWIPSYGEVFGNDSLYYGLFQDEPFNRIKMLSGSAAWWWLRNKSRHDVDNVNSLGNNGESPKNSSGGVCLGFCL